MPVPCQFYWRYFSSVLGFPFNFLKFILSIRKSKGQRKQKQPIFCVKSALKWVSTDGQQTKSVAYVYNVYCSKLYNPCCKFSIFFHSIGNKSNATNIKILMEFHSPTIWIISIFFKSYKTDNLYNPFLNLQSSDWILVLRNFQRNGRRGRKSVSSKQKIWQYLQLWTEIFKQIYGNVYLRTIYVYV